MQNSPFIIINVDSYRFTCLVFPCFVIHIKKCSHQRSNPEESLKIFPNPFTNTAVLSIINPEENTYTLYLQDLSGKIVKTVNNFTVRKTEITRDGSPAG
jgi:hypothetical protein